MNIPTPRVINQREFERRPWRTRALLIVQNEAPVTVRTFDISPGGVGILSETNPPVDAVCAIRLFMPHESPVASLDFNARVSHSLLSSSQDGFKVGLQFMKSSREQVVQLIRILGFDVARPAESGGFRPI